MQLHCRLNLLLHSQSNLFLSRCFAGHKKVKLKKLTVKSHFKMSLTEMYIRHRELSHRMMKLPYFVFWFL